MFEVGKDGILKIQDPKPADPIEVKPESVTVKKTEPVEAVQPKPEEVKPEPAPMQAAPVQEEAQPDNIVEQEVFNLCIVMNSGKIVKVPIVEEDYEEIKLIIEDVRLSNKIFSIGGINMVAAHIDVYYLEEVPEVPNE